MTMHEPDDLRDARIDAAWRAASDEEPPRALDDAIRAAARRGVGAGPTSAGTATPSRVPQSLRPERWWWPLAAAATIGAVAIGLLQVVEPERVVAPVTDTKDAVSDSPYSAQRATQEEVIVTPTPGSPPVPPDPTPERQATPAVLAQDPAAEANALPPPPLPPAKTLRKDVATPFPREEAATAPPSVAPPVAETAPAPVPMATPFPADKLESQELQKQQIEKRDSAPAPVAQAAASSADASMSGSASGKLEAMPAKPAASEPTREPQRGAPLTTQDARARRSLANTDASSGAPASTLAQANQMAPRAKVAPKLPVPEWVALIRKLRDEGKTDEALKELTAFRNAYAEPEQLLPPDLRDWKPVQ